MCKQTAKKSRLWYGSPLGQFTVIFQPGDITDSVILVTGYRFILWERNPKNESSVSTDHLYFSYINQITNQLIHIGPFLT